MRQKHLTEQFARSLGEYSAPVITTGTNLFLELQNFILELVKPSLEIIKLFLLGLESFSCLFGIRTNIMGRRIRFDLRMMFV